MGNQNSVILQRNLAEDMPRLYWPTPPYEGPMKVRFACASCGNEAIELQPFPTTWNDLMKLIGLCFTCNAKKRIKTLFVEFAKEREPLFTYNGDRRELNNLGIQLRKFLKSAPSTETIDPGQVNFKRICHPPNIRTKALPPNFQWSEGMYGKGLGERRRALLQTTKNVLRGDSEQWMLVIPSRDQLLQYACKQFLSVPPQKLRSELCVKFLGEPGLDLGGVTREFFSEVSKQLLDPKLGLFEGTGPNQTFHPSPSSGINELHLDYFRFFGRLVGKALYEGIAIHANFTRAVFKLMLGKAVSFSDFQTVDKELYKNFKELLTYDDLTLESLSLDFTALTEDTPGKKTVHELVEGGSQLTVTRANIHEYVKVYSSWRMVDSVETQLKCFLEGFYDVLPVQLLSFFHESELEIMLCGMPEIDVNEWKLNTIAINFPSLAHPILTWFWEIMEEFDQHQRALIFHFTTGTGRLLSFEYLNPPFTIYFLANHEPDCLPYGHTCFNRIDFPNYPSKEVMQQKLLAAIEYGSVGFALE